MRKLKREYELKKERQKEFTKNLADIEAGKEIELDSCAGLNEQMSEVRKNLDMNVTEVKTTKSNIARLEIDRNECIESLKQLHV